MTIDQIKKLGKEKSTDNLMLLIDMYHNMDLPIEQKREVVSSIGRQKNKDIILSVIIMKGCKKMKKINMILAILLAFSFTLLSYQLPQT